MCGIVGYVGERPALDVVLDGLRRLEYRGYDSAGVAIVGDGELLTAKKAGKLANLEKALVERRRDRLDRAAPPASGTPAGPPTAARPTATPTRTSTADGRVAVIHNGIIENFAALRAELEADGDEFACDTDTEVRRPPARRELAAREPASRRRTCRRGDAAGLPPAGGRVHPARRRRATHPTSVVGARRNSPAGGRPWRRRELPRLRRRGVHRAHPRGGRAGPGPGRRAAPRTASTITDFDGSPAAGPDYHVDWDASAAEKGGYDYFMLKEIAEQPQAVADTLLGRIGADRR